MGRKQVVAMGLGRILDSIFCVYFITHIPITIFIDSQVFFPTSWYPKQLVDLLHWYSREYKDCMVVNPPSWFVSFVACECAFQFPFFFIATYAFWKGGCRWVRLPAAVYGTHVATTVIAILFHIMLHDFSSEKVPGPETLEERLTLFFIYFPYFLVPLLIVLRVCFSEEYRETT